MKIPVLSQFMEMSFGPIKMEYLLALLLFALIAVLLSKKLKRGKAAHQADAVLEDSAPDVDEPARKASRKKVKAKKIKGEGEESGAPSTTETIPAQDKPEIISMAPAELAPLPEPATSGILPAGASTPAKPALPFASATDGSTAAASVSPPASPAQGGEPEALSGDLKSLFEEEIAANPEMAALLAKLDDVAAADISKQSKEILGQLIKIRGK